jgi:hypothetical protein
MIGPIDGAAQKLGAHTTTLRAIINFDLDCFRFLLLLRGKAVPPTLKIIEHEITGFSGTTIFPRLTVALQSMLIRFTDAVAGRSLYCLTLSKIASVSGTFFWLRFEYFAQTITPIRFNTTDIVLGEGNCAGLNPSLFKWASAAAVRRVYAMLRLNVGSCWECASANYH